MGGTLEARLSRRARGVRPFLAMRLLARARELESQGRDIIHLEVGEPDFGAPQAVMARAQAALAAGESPRYTPAQGLPELRQAIARFYETREGVSVDWRRIVVTPGASGALVLAIAALLDPGQGILLSDPGYPSNRHIARILGVEAHAVPVDEAIGFQPDGDRVRAHWQANSRALLLTSPANPTGAVIEGPRLETLVRTAADLGLTLVMDEIYRGLVYGPPPPTILTLSDHAWVVNSFSKYFGMTGWRLGWLVCPESAVTVVDKLAQNLFLSPPALSQDAALAAFEPESLAELERRRSIFQARRDYLLEALQRLGFRIPVPPRGAFYVYADCSALGADALSLAERFLEEAGVAVTPGIDFGQQETSHFLRFAYTTDLERLAEAVRRLQRVL